jgi:hypothetical protein
VQGKILKFLLQSTGRLEEIWQRKTFLTHDIVQRILICSKGIIVRVFEPQTTQIIRIIKFRPSLIGFNDVNGVILKLFIVSFKLLNLIDLPNVFEFTKHLKLFLCHVNIAIKFLLLKVFVHEVVSDFIEVKSLEVFWHVDTFFCQSISVSFSFVFCLVADFQSDGVKIAHLFCQSHRRRGPLSLENITVNSFLNKIGQILRPNFIFLNLFIENMHAILNLLLGWFFFVIDVLSNILILADIRN